MILPQGVDKLITAKKLYMRMFDLYASIRSYKNEIRVCTLTLAYA